MRFGAAKMTKASNKLAFQMWLNGCTEHALNMASPTSIARSYGLLISDVQNAIAGEQLKRSAQ